MKSKGAIFLLCFLSIGWKVFAQQNNPCLLETVDQEGKVVQVVEPKTKNLNIAFKSVKAIFNHPQYLISGEFIEDANLKHLVIFRRYGENEIFDVPCLVQANSDRTVFTITLDEPLILSEDYSLAIRTSAKGYGKSGIFDGIKFTTSEWDAFQAGGFGSKDYSQLTDMHVDEVGNIYITGYFRGQIHFGEKTLYSKAKYAAFLVKYDKSGFCLWAKMVQGQRYFDYAQAQGLTIDIYGNIYLVGRFNGSVQFDKSESDLFLTSDGRYNVFIAKYDSNGDVLWADEAGGIDVDFGCDIAVDHDQNVYFSGSFSKKARFKNSHWIKGNGGFDTFLAKYNDQGNLLWVRSALGDGFEDNSRARALALDIQGNIYLSGVFRGKINLGNHRMVSKGSFDVYVAKYTPSGRVVWTYSLGGYGWDYVHDLKFSKSNLYITGNFTGHAAFGKEVISSIGDSDIYLAKMNAHAPEIVWVRKADGTSWDKSMSVALDTAQNTYITGSFYNTLNFGIGKKLYAKGSSDIFIAKYNPEGEVIWVKGAGSKTHNDQGRSVFWQKAEEKLYVAGTFNGSVRFGTVLIRSYGNTNIFVWRM